VCVKVTGDHTYRTYTSKTCCGDFDA